MSLYKRKDSKEWWISFTHNGKRIQQSTGTSNEKLAQEYHDKLKASQWDQDRLGIKPGRSWQEAVVQWIAETSHKATHKEDISKLKWLDPFLGHLRLDEITRDVIRHIAQEKRKPYKSFGKNGKERLISPKPATVNRYLSLIRSILVRAKDEWEWIDSVPKIKQLEEPLGRERSITPEQAGRLIDELPKHQRDVVLFALLTGLRQSNVLKLEWDRVDMEKCHAWVQATQSKNRKAIAVPLNTDAMAILQRNMGKHPCRVFTYAGKPLENANNPAWRAALKRAGITDFRWHDLRHSWATWHRKAGTPTHELQRLGGWKTASMVERYAHLGSDQLTGAAARLNSILPCYVFATVAEK